VSSVLELGLLPAFAPLSRPMVIHLLLGKRRRSLVRADNPSSVLFQETGYTQDEWDALEQEVRIKRQEVEALMYPLVQSKALSTEWLRQTLNIYAPGEKSEQISLPTLTVWRKRGLLIYEQRNRPEATSAAALLIARMIDVRERNWLPASIEVGEPRWWCWRQDDPQLDPTPCPLPLSERFPPGTLFWTPWVGAAWDSHWMRINSLGAIRWAGAVREDQQTWWTVSEQDMQHWDPKAAALNVPLLGMARHILQRIADLALMRLAFARLIPADHARAPGEPSSR